MNRDDGTHHLSFQEPRQYHTQDAVGDPLCIPKPDKVTRVVFGNLNGSKMDTPWSKFQSSLKELIELQGDLIGLSEINVDTQKPAVISRLKSDVRQQFQHSHMIAGSSPVSSSGVRKPGGTMSLVLGDVVGRVSSTHVDPIGRWTAHHLQGKAGGVLTVVSLYLPCQNTKTSMTVWNQHRAALAASQRSDETPLKAFSTDLKAFLRECSSKGHQLIVGGDFNSEFSNSGILHELCSDQDLDLLDVIGLRHPEAVSAPTYIRSSRRIDYILISQSLMDSVVSCGYLPFGEFVDSDHRFAFIDFPTEKLFGDPAKMAPLIRRDIQANNPVLVTKYVEALQKYLDHQNFWSRAEKLKALIDTSNPDHKLAEKLNKVLTDAKLHAEKQCRYDRRYWWSLPLAKAEEEVRVLSTALQALKHDKSAPSRSPRRQALIQIDLAIPQNVPEITQLLKETTAKRDNIRRNSRQYRDAFLQQCIDDAKAAGNLELATIYRDLLRQEMENRKWTRLAVLKDKVIAALSAVDVPISFLDPEIPNEDPTKAAEWETVVDPTGIEYQLNHRNVGHFRQALGTPFTIHPLKGHFDWAASSSESEAVLDGTYDSSHLPALQQEFLSRCRLVIPSPESGALPLLTAAEWIHRVKRWAERTTTSPSGLHLGHAKALIAPFSVPRDSTRGAAIQDTQTAVIDAHLTLINYAIRHKYSYDRWKTIVNVMIEKTPGDRRINKLRVIHLYEYDFSLLLAVHWKRMMWQAETRGSINDGQYGGRKDRNPQSLVLFEELKNEICRFSRKSLVNFDNDAKSCYDRILPSVASLLGRVQGIHKHVVFVHAKTLEEARYKLRTALGVSKTFAQNCDLQPWFGTGQGSTNSPMIWTLVSSALFDIHNDLSHGAEFISPDGSIHIRITIVGFVDDSNCNTNNFAANDQSDLESLLEAATHDAQLWANLLWLSGGLLELPKCSYHVIFYTFRSCGRPQMSYSQHTPIHVTDQFGEQVRITQYVVSKAHKTLGHLKAPDDGGTTQLAAIRKACVHLQQKVHKYPFRPSDADTFYHQVVTPKFNYILPQCYSSSAELNRVSAGLQSECARACGFSGSMHTAIRYGPPALGGAGLIEFYTHQGRGQILNLLRSVRSNTMLRKVWLCTLSWAQLSAGVHYPLLEHPSRSIPYLEGRYIKSLRGFLASINGSLIVREVPVPRLQREGDMHLMTFALRYMHNPHRKSPDPDEEKHKQDQPPPPRHPLRTGTTKEDKKKRWKPDPPKTRTTQWWETLNCSRLFYQAVTLSDIVNVKGTEVQRSFHNLGHHYTLPTTKWLHVNQVRPSNTGPWNKLLKCINDYLKLAPLGPWLAPPSELRMQWPMYYDHANPSLYVRDATDPACYVLYLPRRHTPLKFRRSEHRVSTVPDTSRPYGYPKNLGKNPRYVILRYLPATPSEYVSPVPREPTFIRYISHLEENMRQLLSRVRFRASPVTFFATLTGTLSFCSDGSAPASSMSFGWSSAHSGGLRLAECCGPAFGSISASQRSEGYGLLSAVLFLYHCFIHFQLTLQTWDAEFWSDNKTLIDACNLHTNGEWPIGDTLSTDFDLIAPILHFVNLLPVPSCFRHVYGHQDRHCTFENLPLESQLNVEADALALQYRHSPDLDMSECQHPFPGNPANLILRHRITTTRYSEQILFAASAPALIDHMRENFGWDEWTYSSIDWVTHKSYVSTQQHRKIQLTKLLHDQLPTAAFLAKSSKCHSACARCGFPKETFDHMLQCSHSRDWLRTTLQKVASACSSLPSNVFEVMEEFLICLEMWCIDGCASTFRGNNKLPPSIAQAIHAQSKIGWNQVFRGRLASGWRLALRSSSSSDTVSDFHPNEPDPWSLTVSNTLTDQFFILWEARNNAVHSKKRSHDANVFKSRLHHRIAELHRLFPKTRILDRDNINFLTEDPSDIATIDDFVLRNNRQVLFEWVQLNHPLITESVRLANIQDVSQKSIPSFFQRIPKDRHARRQRHRRIRRTDPDVPPRTKSSHKPRHSKSNRSSTPQRNVITEYVSYTIRPRNPDVPIRRPPPAPDPHPNPDVSNAQAPTDAPKTKQLTQRTLTPFLRRL